MAMISRTWEHAYPTAMICLFVDVEYYVMFVGYGLVKD